MTVDLLLILLLHTEDYLRGHNSLIRVHESEVGVEAERGGILEEVSGDWFIVHCVLHVVTGLIHSQQCETVKNARVDFFTTIRDDADNNLGSSSLPDHRTKVLWEVPFSTHLSPTCASFSENIGVQYSSSNRVWSGRIRPRPPIS